MASNPVQKLTEEQYLAIERAAETKSEFYNGEMFAMSGATFAHVKLSTNMLFELVLGLGDGPCQAYGPDLRIRVRPKGLYTYPDASVVCGEPILADNRKDTLLNPAVVVEVLSPSTEKYDRGTKFVHYRQVASLQDFILVSQDALLVEHYTRQSDETWTIRTHTRLDDELRIDSIGVSIPMPRIYRGIEFEADAHPKPPPAAQ